MKVLIQRVKEAAVRVDDQVVGEIGPGLLVFLGVHSEDTEKEVDYLVNKVVNMRLFPGEKSDFDQSVLEEQKSILAVSQFTLYASCKKGRRPDFGEAAKPEQARKLYDLFVEKLKETGLTIATGQFQTHMEVSLVNDGPVTIMVESAG